MRIITAPQVYLVGHQTVSSDELDRFLSDHGVSWESDSSVGSEVLVETAGRVCYMSYARPRPGGNKSYIQHILEARHGSVLEHAVFSLLITGISRSLSHEFVRHRHMSFSQLSQRYVDESSPEYVVPEIIAADASLFSIWRKAMQYAHDSYVQLTHMIQSQLEAGSIKTVRQAARSVLPNATETKLFVTANARAWRHFLLLRGSKQADPEIRRLAIHIYKTLVSESPNLFEDIQVQTDETLSSSWGAP